MKKTLTPPQELLGYLHSDDWFSKDAHKSVLIRYYSFPTHDGNEIGFFPPPDTDICLINRPFRILMCNIDGQHYSTSSYSFIAGMRGPTLYREKINRVLPTSTYILISTPIIGIKMEDIEKSAEAMDQCVGILRAVTGNGFLRELVREEILDIPSGELHSLSKNVLLPHPAEGPFISGSKWGDVGDIMSSLSLLKSDKIKARLFLSCRLFEMAARSEDVTKFFLYWVSLEVLCGTDNADKIAEKISSAYTVDKNYIKQNLGFKKLIRLRQDLVHRGILLHVQQETERYIQVLFLDLIRAELELPCQNHLSDYIKSQFDIGCLEKDSGRHVVHLLDDPPP